MSDWFSGLLDWVGQHPGYAGWIVFGVTLVESLAIVGAIIPGVIVLLGVGVLIGTGVLDFWSMCLWAIAGGIIGDGLSYWLGHHFDYLTERWRWFRLHPDQLQKGIAFFAKYGEISVALGRFFGPLRAVVPLIAGLMRMPPQRFYTANVLSALVWAPAYLAPGMLFGEIVEFGDWRKLLFPLAAISIIVPVWLLIQARRRP